eukprot:scaffold8409_cov248-Pinguiococcus_pyrenoidosus.AAC.1
MASGAEKALRFRSRGAVMASELQDFAVRQLSALFSNWAVPRHGRLRSQETKRGLLKQLRLQDRSVLLRSSGAMQSREAESHVVAGSILPWTLRPVDAVRMREQMDELYGTHSGSRDPTEHDRNVSDAPRIFAAGVPLAWKKEQTATGSRKRDYGTGIPLWSP